MDITEVRIKLTEDSDDRLQAFCSITFDDSFVVRDLKIIEGSNGPFVAMPSRKLTSHCNRCGSKNHLRANYCNQCGAKLDAARATRDLEGRAKLYADIAHPINSQCREMIQQRVIAEFQREIELAKEPGYVSRYEDDYDDDYFPEDEPIERGASSRTSSTSAPSSSAPSSPTPSSLPSPPSREHTKIEPAASEPRAPHQNAPAEKPATPHAPPDERPNHGFGAGILDD